MQIPDVAIRPDHAMQLSRYKRATGNVWSYFEDAEVYVRVSRRFINDSNLTFFDLANFCRPIRVGNLYRESPKPKSTGFMGRLLAMAGSKVEEMKLDGIYVECILNEWLPEWFERQGFEYHEAAGGVSPSMYRIKKEN